MSKTGNWVMELEQLHSNGECKPDCQFCYEQAHPLLYNEPEYQNE